VRLHAFLALTFGALLVATLTPSAQLRDVSLRDSGFTVVGVDGLRIVVKQGTPSSGRNLIFRQADGDRFLRQVGEVYLRDPAPGTGDKRLIADSSNLELKVDDVLVHASLVSAATSSSRASAGKRLAIGFGDTCGKIGILIAMASVIGTCLLESGAARRIVQSTRELVGEQRTPIAFTVSGFVVGIPVFFDTVFYLLMPLAKAMRLRTGKDYLLYVMSIVVGATMAHSLVPPTPGPLFVASEMGVGIGEMMLGGLVVGAIAVASGFLYILWANRVWEIPLRDEVDGSIRNDEAATEDTGADDSAALPSLGISLLPILLPVILLTSWTFLDARMTALSKANVAIPAWMATAKPVVDFLGDKNIALMISAAVAIGMLLRQRIQERFAERLRSLQTALSSGGVIILITSAGGAFGHVLRESGVAGAIQQRFPTTDNSFMLLVLAFCITAIVRFAQGSATVAMITSVSIIAPLAAGIELAYAPLYLALAIGCGSKPLPWMNDSGFWVVGRMSGMTEGETLKTFSVTLTLMGIVGFLVTLAGAYWLPLV
jgi:GntP family gluconate:H+ symporter